MIGVVLWSDAALSKAVIWCEDQGDLAFFRQGEECSAQQMTAGDWVEFDLILCGNLRIAENPVVLKEPASPEIAEKLQAVTASGGAARMDSAAAIAPPAAPPGQSAAVIPFPGPRCDGSSKAAIPRRLQKRL